jgi:hypothetical protein
MQNPVINNYSIKNIDTRYDNINNLMENSTTNLDSLHESVWESWIHRKENGTKINTLLAEMNTHTLKNYANFLRIKAKDATFTSISLHFDLIKFRCKVLDLIQQRDITAKQAIGYRW